MDSSTTNGADGRRTYGAGNSAPSAEPTREPNPLEPLLKDLHAFREYLLHYLSARSDAAMLSVKRAAMWALLALVAGIAGIAMVVVAVGLLLQGIADGLGLLLGAWAGELLTGGVVLIAVGLGLYLGMQGWIHLSSRQTREKYERRRKQERIACGRDVQGRTRSGRESL